MCVCAKVRAKSQRKRISSSNRTATTRARYFFETRQAGKSGSNNTRNIVESSNVAECRSAAAAASCPPSPTLFCPLSYPPPSIPYSPLSPHLASPRFASPRLASSLATTASSLFSREHHIHTADHRYHHHHHHHYL